MYIPRRSTFIKLNSYQGTTSYDTITLIVRGRALHALLLYNTEHKTNIASVRKRQLFGSDYKALRRKDYQQVHTVVPTKGRKDSKITMTYAPIRCKEQWFKYHSGTRMISEEGPLQEKCAKDTKTKHKAFWHNQHDETRDLVHCTVLYCEISFSS